MRTFITATVLFLCALFADMPAGAQSRTELGVADSFVVQGMSGSKTDPDVKLSGYTLFGTNAAGAVAVTSGVGNVYIQNSLEVGSNVYLRGVGLIYPDVTTQTTAYVKTQACSLASGECDTNRLDVLFSTSYRINAVRVWQASVLPQAIRVYTNGVQADSFDLSTASASRTVVFNMQMYDRLGIACTNTGGTVLFCFEGYRQ
jgi:hypothetical protein